MHSEDLDRLSGPGGSERSALIAAALAKWGAPDRFQVMVLIVGGCSDERALEIGSILTGARPVIGAPPVAMARDNWRPGDRFVLTASELDGSGVMFFDANGQPFASWDAVGRFDAAGRAAATELLRITRSSDPKGLQRDLWVLDCAADRESAGKYAELKSALVASGWEPQAFLHIRGEGAASEVQNSPLVSVGRLNLSRIPSGGVVLFDPITKRLVPIEADSCSVQGVSAVAINMRRQRVWRVMQDIATGNYNASFFPRHDPSQLAWLDCGVLMGMVESDQSWPKPFCGNVFDFSMNSSVGVLAMWLMEGVRLNQRFHTDLVLPGRTDDPVREARIGACRSWWKRVAGLESARGRLVSPQDFTDEDLGW